MAVRRYVLPSNQDERRTLVEEMCRWATEVLGYPTRQANIARWNQMPITELRRVHANWQELMHERGRMQE